MDPKLFNIIKKIINEWDPAHLLSLDFPKDEYHQMQSIEEITVNEIGKIINNIIKEYLGEEYMETEEKINEKSRRILKEIRQE